MSEPTISVEDSAATTLHRMITGSWIAQAIYVAAKLGIADLLNDGPQHAEALARAKSMHPRALYRVLRALASVGIFSEDDQGRFGLTGLAEPLRSDASDSLRAFAIMQGSEWVWRSWGEIMHSVRTEKSPFEHVFGMPLFDYYAANPEAGRISAEGLTSRSKPDNTAVGSAYEFSNAQKVVDVGGGQGTLLASILAANSHLRGALLEKPHVIPMARAVLEQAGVAARCELVSGNFFTSVPAGGDVYILKKVIHDWNDDQARTILRVCRQSMRPKARLLLMELVVLPGNQHSHAKLLDLLMLVYAGGRERTEPEYRTLLASAGFSLDRVIATSGPVSILEALPA
jgi:hypothetical protein